MSATLEDSYPWQEPSTVIARGAFIVVEGLDRAGKTTQVKKLCDKLYASGHNIKTIRFPGNHLSNPPDVFRSFKLYNYLIYAKIKFRPNISNRKNDRQLPPKLHRNGRPRNPPPILRKPLGESVRLTPSLSFPTHHMLNQSSKWIETHLSKGYTIICDRYYYSGMVYSAAKHNPSLSLAWAQTPDVGLPRPDAVVFLNLEAVEAEKRGGYGEEKYEKREMQQRVRELFLGLLVVDGDEKEMRVVDAGETVEVVGERIWQAVEPVMQSVGRGKAGVGKVKAWGSQW